MSLMKKGLLLTFLKFMNSGLGFLRFILIPIIFKTGGLTDALLISCFIPIEIGMQVVKMIRVTLVPVLIEHHEKKNSDGFFTVFFFWWFMVSLVISIVIALLSSIFIKMISSGFDQETHALSSQFLMMLTPCFFVFCLFGAFEAYLHIRHKFYITELSRTAFRIVSIFFLYFFAPKMGIKSYIWGLVIASMCQFVIPLLSCPSLFKDIIPNTKLFLKKRDIQLFLKSFGVVFITFLLTTLENIIDRNFTSYMIPGSVTILALGSRFSQMIPGLLATSFFSIFLPKISRVKSQGKDLDSLIGILWCLFLMIGVFVSVSLIWIFPDVIELLKSYGKLQQSNTDVLIKTIQACAVSIPAFFCVQVLRGVFLVKQKIKETVAVGFLCVFVHLGFDFLLYSYGPKGIALSASLTLWVAHLYLLFKLRVNVFKIKEFYWICTACFVFVLTLFAIQWKAMFDHEIIGTVSGLMISLLFYCLILIRPFLQLKEKYIKTHA